MQIQFAAHAADAGVLVLLVEKDGLSRLSFGAIAAADQQTILGAARANRFEGEAGAISETFVAANGDVRRIVLLGVGNGGEADYERAGGALTARFLTSGVAALTVDFSARRVARGDTIVHLTPIEYRLLTTLIRHAGKVLTHAQLLREVWGPGHAERGHYLRIYMGHLRQKLEHNPARPAHILTETGVGYRFIESEHS